MLISFTTVYCEGTLDLRFLFGSPTDLNVRYVLRCVSLLNLLPSLKRFQLHLCQFLPFHRYHPRHGHGTGIPCCHVVDFAPAHSELRFSLTSITRSRLVFTRRRLFHPKTFSVPAFLVWKHSFCLNTACWWRGLRCWRDHSDSCSVVSCFFQIIFNILLQQHIEHIPLRGQKHSAQTQVMSI